MIELRKPSAAGFAAGILFISFLAMSAPVSAGGGGIGGGGSRGGPGRPPRRFFWKVLQLAGQSEVVAPFPTSQSPALPARLPGIVVSKFATDA